jgi:muconolactone D-isomerase
MEFLVEIEVRLPPTIASTERQRLLVAEMARGLELIQLGVIKRIWRIPGRFANVAVYDAKDATDLHSAIASLPLFPWLDVKVTALAVHPLEAESRAT